MGTEPFEFAFLHTINNPFYQTLTILGIFILLFGLVSLFVKERLYLTESLVAIIVGILFGPVCANILIPKVWFGDGLYKFLMEFSRVVISLQVMAAGLSVPQGYIKKQWRSMAMLLGPLMVIMWAVSAFAVKLIMGLDWWPSLMIGACLAPTDPVLAHAVIKGKFANRYIPSHLRNLLSIESGANDGLGFPFLMLPIYVLLHSPGDSMKAWFVETWLYKIFLSIVIGIVMGLSARYLLEKSEKRRLIDKESFLVYSIALALSITGIVSLLDSDDLLAVFTAGVVFAHDDRFNQATKDSHFQEVLDMLFNISYFIFLGAIFPWADYKKSIGQLFGVAIVVLALRRLPFMMLAKPLIPQLKSYKEAFFAGWFGPMGVGAIFFTMVTRHHPKLPIEVADDVFTVVSFVVFCSIVIHGITVPITHVSLKSQAKRRLRRELRRNRIHSKDDDSQLRDIPISLESSVSEAEGLNEKGEVSTYGRSGYDLPPESEMSEAEYSMAYETENEDGAKRRTLPPPVNAHAPHVGRRTVVAAAKADYYHYPSSAGRGGGSEDGNTLSRLGSSGGLDDDQVGPPPPAADEATRRRPHDKQERERDQDGNPIVHSVVIPMERVDTYGSTASSQLYKSDANDSR